MQRDKEGEENEYDKNKLSMGCGEVRGMERMTCAHERFHEYFLWVLNPTQEDFKGFGPEN